MRCENKTFLQNDPGFFQEISSTAVEVGLEKSNAETRSAQRERREEEDGEEWLGR